MKRFLFEHANNIDSVSGTEECRMEQKKTDRPGRKAALMKRGLTVLLASSLLLLTGCGSSSDIENAYQPYSSDFTTSSGGLSFFADELCVTNDVNYGPNQLTRSTSVEAAGAFNITTHECVYSQNVFEKMYPASTTKVLTAYIILRNCDLNDVVTVSYDAANPDANSSVCGLKEGDQITVHDLLYGMMLESGNDAAIALAEHCSGSIDKFADLMNEEASKLGATCSHFMNPSGLPDDNHYTTVYDMYLILQAACTLQQFTDIASTKNYTAKYTDKNGTAVTNEWENTCNFINGVYDLPDGFTLIAAKTGTTSAAGNCLVLATQNPSGEHIVSIVYHADLKYTAYQLTKEILAGFAK